MEKKKKVFVDGASLYAMRSRLGISQYDDRVLHTILTTEIGEAPAAKALYVTSDKAPLGVLKALRSAQYEVITANSKNGKDDRAIIDRIKSLNPDSIAEIVMLSNDQDYVPALLEKVEQGIKVFWVGTRKAEHGEKSAIGDALNARFEKDFTFFELHDIKERIMKAAYVPAAERNRKVSIGLEGSVPHEDIERLGNAIMRICKRYPQLHFTIQS